MRDLVVRDSTRSYFRDDRTLVRERPGAQTIIWVDAGRYHWATREWLPNDLRARLEEGRKRNRRAPLGDSHGAWQKVAEIPYDWLTGKIPTDAWDDKKAMARLLNDSDHRDMRADGDHRRL